MWRLALWRIRMPPIAGESRRPAGLVTFPLSLTPTPAKALRIVVVPAAGRAHVALAAGPAPQAGLRCTPSLPFAALEPPPPARCAHGSKPRRQGYAPQLSRLCRGMPGATSGRAAAAHVFGACAPNLAPAAGRRRRRATPSTRNRALASAYKAARPPPAVPFWSPDRTEFTVSVNMSGNKAARAPCRSRSSRCSAGPPARTTLVVRGGEIVVTRGPDDAPDLQRPKGGATGGGKAGARRP